MCDKLVKQMTQSALTGNNFNDEAVQFDAFSGNAGVNKPYDNPFVRMADISYMMALDADRNGALKENATRLNDSTWGSEHAFAFCKSRVQHVSFELPSSLQPVASNANPSMLLSLHRLQTLTGYTIKEDAGVNEHSLLDALSQTKNNPLYETWINA